MAIAQQYIQLLDTCLATYCQPMYQLLQPPLEKSAIEAYFNKWQIEDENLMDIFLWKNGIVNDGVLPTLTYNYTEFGVIPTLEHINELIQLEAEYASWKSSFFPIVTSFGGDFFLYEANRQSSDYGMLFLQCPTFGNVGEFVVSYYDSIEQMILTITECFKTKAFVYNQDKMWLDVNHSLVTQIAKKNNPKSEYWLDGW